MLWRQRIVDGFVCDCRRWDNIPASEGEALMNAKKRRNKSQKKVQRKEEKKEKGLDSSSCSLCLGVYASCFL